MKKKLLRLQDLAFKKAILTENRKFLYKTPLLMVPH